MEETTSGDNILSMYLKNGLTIFTHWLAVPNSWLTSTSAITTTLSPLQLSIKYQHQTFVQESHTSQNIALGYPRITNAKAADHVDQLCNLTNIDLRGYLRG